MEKDNFDFLRFNVKILFFFSNKQVLNLWLFIHRTNALSNELSGGGYVFLPKWGLILFLPFSLNFYFKSTSYFFIL